MKNITFPIPLALLILALLVLIPYVFTGFATADDLGYYLDANTSEFSDIISYYATNQGRFAFYITSPIIHSVYLFDSVLFAKTMNIILVLGNVFLLYLIVKEIFQDKWFAYLAVLITLVFITGKGWCSAISSYPVFFSNAFLFVQLAIFFTFRGIRDNRMLFHILSAILLLFSFVFYEAFLMYIFLVIIIIIALKKKTARSMSICYILNCIKPFIPYLAVVVFFLASYWSYRQLHPSSYDGNVVSEHLNIGEVFKVTEVFASGAYPLKNAFASGNSVMGGGQYLSDDNLDNIIDYIFIEHLGWLFKAILIAYLFYFIIQKVEIVSKRKLLFVLLVSTLYIYLPHLPLSITQKYLGYGGFSNYVTTYFAFYAVMLSLSILVLAVSLVIKLNIARKTLFVVFAISLGISSIINDYSNYKTVLFLRQSKDLFGFMERIAKTSDYTSLKPNTVIYAPSLYKINSLGYLFAQYFNWSTFMQYKSGFKAVDITKEDNFLNDSTTNKYYMGYFSSEKTIDQYIVFSSFSTNSHIEGINKNIISDSAVVFYASRNKLFSLMFNFETSKDSTVMINNQLFKDNNFSYVLRNNSFDKNFIKIVIKAKNINLETIVLTDIIVPTSNNIDLD